jgi:hypothetical protein
LLLGGIISRRTFGHAEIELTEMWEFEGEVDHVKKFFVFLCEVFLEVGYFLMDGVSFAAVGLEGGRQFIHEFASKQVEVLVQAFL